METLERNRIIAEFMGDVTTDSAEWVSGQKRLVGEYLYHTSWNWLMPVVLKIGSTHTNKIPTRIIIEITTVLSMSIWGEGQYYGSGQKESSIFTVWEQVVAFIQWYNSQSK